MGKNRDKETPFWEGIDIKGGKDVGKYIEEAINGIGRLLDKLDDRISSK